jgi:hypothetical protein
MEINKVIISKLNIIYLGIVCLVFIALVFLLIFLIINSISNQTSPFWPVGYLLLISIFTYLKIKWGIVRRITVSPANIIVDFFIIKEQQKISYREITAIRNLRTTVGRGNSTQGYRIQEIDLIDGSLNFSEWQFENYGDLKNAIYHYMVDMNSHSDYIEI